MIKKTQFCVFRKILFAVFFQFMAIKASADTLDGPEPPPSDAPIDDWLIPFLVIALVFGGYFYYKRSKSQLIK